MAFFLQTNQSSTKKKFSAVKGVHLWVDLSRSDKVGLSQGGSEAAMLCCSFTSALFFLALFLLKDFIDQKRDEKDVQKSLSPIFRCTTPSTGQIRHEEKLSLVHYTVFLFLLSIMNTMMFNSSHFFPSQNCYYASSKMSKFSPSGSMFISGLSDRKARKVSGAKGAKRQTSARSANVRATPGWPAGNQMNWTKPKHFLWLE